MNFSQYSFGQSQLSAEDVEKRELGQVGLLNLQHKDGTVLLAANILCVFAAFDLTT
jgi:hypothetical protein